MKYPLILILMILSLSAKPNEPFSKEWKKVDSLADLGQAQTALEIVESIYSASKASGMTDQYLKAILYRFRLKSMFEEDMLKKSIASTENELSGAGFPEKNILHSILADLYWKFYEENRWKFLDRTGLMENQSTDPDTWDLAKIVKVCNDHYTLSLADEDKLKAIQVNLYDAILEGHPESRNFRPALFDFLIHRAIDFYSNTESGLTQPAAKFLVNDKTYFNEAAAFANAKITTTDTLAFEYITLKLYQKLILSHLNDAEPSALVYAGLERLRLVHEKCILPEKDSLYLESLQLLGNSCKGLPVSADVSYEKALLLQSAAAKYNPFDSRLHQWDYKESRSIARNILNEFPGSLAAENCKALIQQIETPFLEITTEYVNVPSQPFLALVSYKNISRIYLRLFQVDEQKAVEEFNSGPIQEIMAMYCKRKPDLSWQQDLPSEGDYQQHKAEIKMPSLKPGFYVLLASPDETFMPDTLVTLNRFWCSQISYIGRRDDAGKYQVYVLDRMEGQPMPKVKVQSIYRDYDYRSRTWRSREGSTYVTDENGYIVIPSKDNGQGNAFSLAFSKGNDRFITENYFYDYGYNPSKPQRYLTTHFFTDRAIYRPGQVIYFKGIILSHTGDKSEIVANHPSEVVFMDVNGNKIAALSLTTNEFGSFSGTFTAPQGVLTGSMTIRDENGSASIQVEEYKRPRFEVTFQPVEGTYKLGENITVMGKAVAYAGNSITNAHVKFRVVRKARFPYIWWGWRNIIPSSPEMEISNGVLTTGDDGEFSIIFPAIPDATIDKKLNPVFTYFITADVSDINGETHTGETSVSVGYSSLIVSHDLPSEVNLDEVVTFRLNITNLNEARQNVAGKMKITRLREPSRMLRERKWSRPDCFTMTRSDFERNFPYDIYDNEDDKTTWESDNIVFEKDFDTSRDTIFTVTGKWQPGNYVLEVVTKDVFGEKVETKDYFTTYSGKDRKFPPNLLAWFAMPVTKAEPGTEVNVMAGSAVPDVFLLYEVGIKDQTMESDAEKMNRYKAFRFKVNEACRGNFSVNLAFVKYNRTFQFSQIVTVPYTNMKLDLAFQSFREKLEPGQEEEWQISIKDYKGEKVAAELLAGMYDASLDAFLPHNWNFSIYGYNNLLQAWDMASAFSVRGSNSFWQPGPYFEIKQREFDRLNWFGFYNYPSSWIGGRIYGMASDRAIAPVMKSAALESIELEESVTKTDSGNTGQKGIPPPQAPTPKALPALLPGPKIRTDFNETAFFFPQLATNTNGEVVLKFKMPESLTRWKMMGLAYTKDLKTGQVERTLVTQKDLMVFPNAPRFLREGDRMKFSVKITNLARRALSGTAELHFFDALSMKPVDDLLLQQGASQAFEVGVSGNTNVSWDISVPEGLQALVYRITASSGIFSDGEEAALPVLPNRMLVTETLPLPLRANQTRNFSLPKLLNSNQAGNTLSSYRLTLEFSPNPAWYAVQALPYLMEYPHECAEQLFSRYYSNSLASYIANSDPSIKRVFESWKNISPDALKSNLEKNQELKSILLEETPWVREATSERERKQRIALLFDLNRMSSETNTALRKLQDLQSSNGGWPWFKGMPDDRYITQYIVTGFGHLLHLKVLNPKQNTGMPEMVSKAIEYLDQRMVEDYEHLKSSVRNFEKSDYLGSDMIQYLYARSYFISDYPLKPQAARAVEFYKKQAASYWKKQNNYMKGMLALALNRLGDSRTARFIMTSLSQTAIHHDELGMYWKNEPRGWYWYQAPVETQSLLIEAYDEVLNDSKSVEELKTWLLKQKQTQDWKTTKATAEAVYALLLRGTGLLAGDVQAIIRLGNEILDQGKWEGNEKPEAGTGYFKATWQGSDIKPGMGNVTVTNPNNGIAWGALYWQYFERLDKISPSESPLRVNKSLFREVNTATGPVLEPVTEANILKTGEKVVVRIELQSDRDMEYIHLKDMRASAFEPVNVISGYQWQGGLGYYEATRDASSNFFIGYLPKGTYVFEYRLMATQKGTFSNGITTVQCMYAPEFSSHSEGFNVTVH